MAMMRNGDGAEAECLHLIWGSAKTKQKQNKKTKTKKKHRKQIIDRDDEKWRWCRSRCNICI